MFIEFVFQTSTTNHMARALVKTISLILIEVINVLSKHCKFSALLELLKNIELECAVNVNDIRLLRLRSEFI